MGSRGMFSLSRRGLVIALLVAACLLPAALMWRDVVAHWVAMPYWDEWVTPGKELVAWCNGTLGWAELFSQHNESRKFFPRLVYLALARWHGCWDVRDAMVLTYTCVCAIIILLYRLLRITPGADRLSAIAACALMTWLCFSPAQFENFLWGLQWETFFPGLALLAAANINLSELRFGTKTSLNLLLALVATYTFANGMSLWLLAIPLVARNEETPLKRRLLWLGLYAGCGIAAVLTYFYGYYKPPHHPALALDPAEAGNLLRYLTLWSGNYFQIAALGPFITGTVSLALTLVVMGTAGLVVWRGGARWRWCYSWFLLLLYAALTVFAIAVGRVGFGLDHALDTRYRVFSLFLLLANIGAIHALYCWTNRTSNIKLKHATRLLVVLLFSLFLLATGSTHLNRSAKLAEIYQYRRRLLLALEWIDVIPGNPDLALILPNVGLVKAETAVLQSRGMLRLPFVDARGSLAMEVKEVPHAGTLLGGHLDAAQFTSAGKLRFSGWAWSHAEGRAPDCIVVGLAHTDNTFEPVGVLQPNTAREDVVKSFRKPEMLWTGFWVEFQDREPPPPGTRAGAWVVSLKKQRAWPVNGLQEVTR